MTLPPAQTSILGVLKGTRGPESSSPNSDVTASNHVAHPDMGVTLLFKRIWVQLWDSQVASDTRSAMLKAECVGTQSLHIMSKAA